MPLVNRLEVGCASEFDFQLDRSFGGNKYGYFWKIEGRENRSWTQLGDNFLALGGSDTVGLRYPEGLKGSSWERSTGLVKEEVPYIEGGSLVGGALAVAVAVAVSFHDRSIIHQYIKSTSHTMHAMEMSNLRLFCPFVSLADELCAGLGEKAPLP